MRMKTMSNAIARKHYLHDHDEACYFSQNGTAGGWGFWVDAAGAVLVDDAMGSASGEHPPARIIAACVRAAKKHLAS